MKSQDELNAELETLKQKYGKVYTVTTPMNDDDVCTEFATLFLKKADRTVQAMVNKLIHSSTDSLVAVEACLNATYIGGDNLKDVTSNEDALFGCEAPLVKFLSRVSGTLKKN